MELFIGGIVRFTDNESCCNPVMLPSNVSYEDSIGSQVYKAVTFTFIPLNVLGNMFALLILQHRAWNRSVFTTILKAISVFEIMFNLLLFINLLSFVTEPLKPFLGYGNSVVAAVELLLLLGDSLLIGFQMARNWSVTVLALFRYNMICRSNTVQQNRTGGSFSFFSNQVLPGFFGAMLLFCCALSLPRMFEMSPVVCARTAVICDYRSLLMSNRLYQYGYIGAVMFLFQSGGPIILTSYVSLAVIRKIQYRRRLRKRQGIASSKRFQNSQRNPGTLVLAVCVTFAVLELPSFFSKLEVFISSHSSGNFKFVANSLVYLDSSLNLIIYLASNRTFRTLAFHKLLCRPGSAPLDTADTQSVVRHNTERQ